MAKSLVPFLSNILLNGISNLLFLDWIKWEAFASHFYSENFLSIVTWMRQCLSSNDTLNHFSMSWPTLHKFWSILGTKITFKIVFVPVFVEMAMVPFPFTGMWSPFPILTFVIAMSFKSLKRVPSWVMWFVKPLSANFHLIPYLRSKWQQKIDLPLLGQQLEHLLPVSDFYTCISQPHVRTCCIWNIWHQVFSSI